MQKLFSVLVNIFKSWFTWWMRVAFKVRIQQLKSLRSEWGTTFSLFWWFNPNEISQMTLAGFVMIPMPDVCFFFRQKKQIAGKKKSNWKEKPNDLLLKFNYLSSASFIHRSSTGLIFWADFGVISSFSNLKLFNFGNLRSSFEILLQKRRLNI